MKLSVRYWRGPNTSPLDLSADDKTPALFEEALAIGLAAHLMTHGLAVCVELRVDGKEPPTATGILHPITGKLAWLK